TTVKIHLPIAEVDPVVSASAERTPPRGQGELVLVVEDEPEVRRMAERILTGGGFSVVGTDRGSEALEKCQEDNEIALLLTDVVMPDMLGTDLAERVREVKPELPVIYMSGYSHEVLAPRTMLEEGHNAFLEKPFSSNTLLRTIHELLNPR
ncbi:MAG TPA: response regulator, partial [Solirubrobacterales bacterium]|nr:response regulator [Solirubrobacterales bacterium]